MTPAWSARAPFRAMVILAGLLTTLVFFRMAYVIRSEPFVTVSADDVRITYAESGCPTIERVDVNAFAIDPYLRQLDTAFDIGIILLLLLVLQCYGIAARAWR